MDRLERGMRRRDSASGMLSFSPLYTTKVTWVASFYPQCYLASPTSMREYSGDCSERPFGPSLDSGVSW